MESCKPFTTASVIQLPIGLLQLDTYITTSRSKTVILLLIASAEGGPVGELEQSLAKDAVVGWKHQWNMSSVCSHWSSRSCNIHYIHIC